MRLALLLPAVALFISSGSQAVTITVPNQFSTISGAINAATSGDVIQITSGPTYLEDLFIPQTKTGITLEGLGAAPTIRALHTTSGRSPLEIILAIAGSPGSTDCAGFIIEGNGTTLRNLIIADPTAGAEDPINPTLSISMTLTVFANDVTIEDCSIVADSGSEEHVGIITIAGDWPAFDSNYPLTTPFATSGGYTTPDPVDGLTVTNCAFLHDGDGSNATAFASADFAHLLASGIEALHGTGWNFSGCDFGGMDRVWKTACGAGAVVSDCNFHGNRASLQIAGGSGWVFNDCVFQDSSDGELFELSADEMLGGGSSDATVNDSIFCGGSNDAALILVDEGSLTLNRCLLRPDNSLGHPFAILWRPNQYSGTNLPASSDLTVDQCDIFMANQAPYVIEIETGMLNPPLPPANLVVSNSILTSATAPGIHIDGATVDSGASLDVQYNDFFTSGQPVDDELGWPTSTVANNLNEDPQYNDSSTCPDLGTAPLLFSYNNSNLATAGNLGQALGSQGLYVPSTPTPTPTPSSTATSTFTPTAAPSSTETPTPSETPTDEPSPTSTDTPAPDVTPTASETSTETPSPLPSDTATVVSTPTEISTPSPSPTGSETPTKEPTPTPTGDAGTILDDDGDGDIDAMDLVSLLSKIGAGTAERDTILALAVQWMVDDL